jgi:2-dehydropantoate 2-reductase
VHGTRGGFHIGEIDGGVTARVRALAEALSAVQECEASDDVLGCLWSKIAMASVFFATALVDADVAEILARERYQALMVGLVEETVAAADAMGVRLIELHGFDPESLRKKRRSPAAVRRALDSIAGSFNPLQQRTGIWIDLAVRKRKTEAEPQLGRLISEAEKRGVAMPLNRAVFELITEMEQGHRSFAWENLDEVERRGRELSEARG